MIRLLTLTSGALLVASLVAALQASAAAQGSGVTQPPVPSSAACERLAAAATPAIQITFAGVVAAGTFTPPALPPSASAIDSVQLPYPPGVSRGTFGGGGFGRTGGLGHNGGRADASYAQLPAFCRVSVTLVPTPSSDIRTELWLPMTGWNGRFLGTSQNSSGGSIQWLALANGLRDGFAVVANDTGHRGNEPGWADDQDRRIDFGHRAMHVATLFGKAFTTQFYGRAPSYSYMRECGGGSTAALSSVQNHPEDYDGVVMGGFAAHWTRQTFSQMWPWLATHATPDSTLSPEKIDSVRRAVIASCDALDGVRDGLLENPLRCEWQPSAIACPAGTDTNECLTPPQVEAVRKIYEGPVNPRTGEKLQSGLYRGSEWQWWTLIGPVPLSGIGPMIPFFRNFVFNDPNWDYLARPVNFDSDLDRAQRADVAVINAVKPDISPFVDRGGKLIMVMGWGNATVPPGHHLEYYQNVRAAIGERATERGVRFYTVPGMSECIGGPGTDTFDMFTPLQQWVEQGAAPESVIASKVETDGRVSRTRPLCPFPKVATYSGNGSTDDAANFSCQLPVATR